MAFCNSLAIATRWLVLPSPLPLQVCETFIRGTVQFCLYQGPAVGTGPHELHRIRKGAISPFFSTGSVAEMEIDIQRHASKLFEDLELRVGQVLDIRVYFFAWTTDFITGTIFHSSTGLFWNPERAADWFKIVWDFSGKLPPMKHLPWLVTTGLALPLIAWKLLFPSLVPYISVYKLIPDAHISQTYALNRCNRTHLQWLAKLLLATASKPMACMTNGRKICQKISFRRS